MRRSWVVTVSVAVCACSPPKTRTTSTPDANGKRVDNLDYSKLRPLNPRDDSKREIFAYGEKCMVHVHEDRPKYWHPPKTKQVDCPPSMNDPAWDQCQGGRILKSTESAMCVCTMDGNPPPPPREVDCPK